MRRPEKQVFDRLGTKGLIRVLDDVMDQPRLVRLANACGLKYPGMRTRSQGRERILADLVHQCEEKASARTAVYRALQKETRALSREWTSLSAEEQAGRLTDADLLEANGNLGRHLFLAATTNGGAGLTTLLERLRTDAASPEPAVAPVARQAPPPAPASARKKTAASLKSSARKKSAQEGKSSREETRLKKRIAEHQKKVQHLEGQLTKSREEEKRFKRELIQRKGELAESRMLAERLRRERNAALEDSATPKPAEPEVDAALKKLGQSVRKLAAEQKKLTHGLGKLAESPATPGSEGLGPLQDGIQALTAQLDRLDAARTRDAAEQSRRVDELRTEFQGLRKSLARPTKPRSRSRGAARVGVFVDVQNMYYAARRLKGKLDFDALLQAAVGGRRLIQATAYVVESKEIDQTGFFALLQQRGIEVRRKALKVRADGSMKGDWDMELALDILDAAAQLDVVVLVSGDGDFTSLVKRVKRMGPRVEVIAFPRHTAKSLLEAADKFQPLDRKFMIYPKRSKASARRASPPAKPSAATRSSDGKTQPPTS